MRPVAALLLLVSCGGGQRPHPLSWDTEALAAVHGSAHALVTIDDGVAAFYRTRTDAIAADGGLRGAAYVDATASLDASMRVLLRDMDVTRVALLEAESLVRQARTIEDAPARCRAIVVLDVVVDDIGRVATDAANLGVEVDASIAVFAHQIDSIVSAESAACLRRDAGGTDD